MADEEKLSELSADDIEEIIRENYADIFRYCFWRTKQRSDAEDLTQETFLCFINSLSHYSDRGKPKALLYTIARNLCINWNKRMKPLPLSDETLENISFVEADKEVEIANRLTLHKYMNQLPKDQQEILLLRYYLELQVNEIAKTLGISRFAVMYRLRTAMKNLRQDIRKGGSGF
nr:RNA polymerase sigma factor [uncultured Stomatobaculum sp.]